MKTTKTDFFEELYPIDLHQSFTKNKQPNKNNIDKCEVKRRHCFMRKLLIRQIKFVAGYLGIISYAVTINIIEIRTWISLYPLRLFELSKNSQE